MITQAIICNAAPIIGLMPLFATCDFDFSFAGAPGSHHTTLSHTVPQWASGAAYNSPLTIANLDPASRAPFATAQKWFTTQLVNKVVSVLATTDDPAAPGTKVLDNTLIFWMSEIGDGQNHTRLSEIEYPQVPTNLPLVTKVEEVEPDVKSAWLDQKQREIKRIALETMHARYTVVVPPIDAVDLGSLRIPQAPTASTDLFRQ